MSLTHRSARMVVVALTVALLALAVVDARAASPATCTVETANPEQKDITCRLDGRRFRFDVKFLGGHDDTRASLRVSIDGRPDECGVGSKTSLFGEDGEVHLYCKVEGGRGAKFSVVYSHADFDGFTFVPE